MADDAKNKDQKPDDMDAEGGEGEIQPKKKFGKKQIIIAAVVLVVVVLGAVGAAFLTNKKQESTEQKTSDASHMDVKNKPIYYPLGDMIVNLSGEGKHPNFLKVKVSLELADEKDLPMIEAIKPRIVDNFQVYLRELRVDDLRGSAGLYRLREELLMRVTEAAQPIRVRDVLFQEMLVQ